MFFILKLCSLIIFQICAGINLFLTVENVSGVVTSAPKPDGNTTLPIVPEPTTAAREFSVVNVTAQLPITAQSTAADIRTPPTVEAQTNFINEGDVTEDPYGKPPSHSSTVLIPHTHFFTCIVFFFSKSIFF